MHALKVQQITQSVLMNTSLLASLLLAYKKIVDGELTIGDFVVF